jgi:hypothetical protein
VQILLGMEMGRTETRMVTGQHYVRGVTPIEAQLNLGT